MGGFPTIFWLFIVTSTLHKVDSKSDPVADVCSPLCEVDTTLETECGLLLGCTQLDINDDLFIECWTPCWDVAEKCFRLCADRFDDILQQCYNNCRSATDVDNCIALCFDRLFLDFKLGLVITGNNSGEETTSETVSQPTSSRSSGGSGGRTTVGHHKFPHVEFAARDTEEINVGTAENRVETSGMNTFEKSDMNFTLNVDKSFLNITTRLDILGIFNFPGMETPGSNNRTRTDISNSTNTTRMGKPDFNNTTEVGATDPSSVIKINNSTRVARLRLFILNLFSRRFHKHRLPHNITRYPGRTNSTTGVLRSDQASPHNLADMTSIQSSTATIRSRSPVRVYTFLKHKRTSRKTSGETPNQRTDYN